MAAGYKDPLAETEAKKEKRWQQAEHITERRRRNEKAQLAKAKKEREKYGWLRGGLKGLGTGAGIGAMFGGPVGALIGGGIGALGGGILGGAGPEAEAVVGDLTGAARSVAGGLSDPYKRLLNMYDLQQQAAGGGGTNWGADMSEPYSAEIPEPETFTLGPGAQDPETWSFASPDMETSEGDYSQWGHSPDPTVRWGDTQDIDEETRRRLKGIV